MTTDKLPLRIRAKNLMLRAISAVKRFFHKVGTMTTNLARRVRAALFSPATSPVESPLPADIDVPAKTRFEQVHAEIRDAEIIEVGGVKHRPIRAQGTEEVQDSPTCDACGKITDTFHSSSRRPDDQSDYAALCEECYAHECEDDAIRFTGVSLKKRMVEVRLNAAGLENTIEHTFSLAEDSVFWAATGWWRDRAGKDHAREWSAFARGHVVANVIFDYRRGTYRILVLGKLPRNVGAQRDRHAAQRLATDLWNDQMLAMGEPEQAATTMKAV